MDAYITKHPRCRALLVAIMLLSGSPAIAAEMVTYYHLDALGSPVAASDAQGNIVWRETYQPYGERIQNNPAADTNSRWYTGHAQDQDTGLVYAGARYYDPTIGRFMAVDPVSFTEKNMHSFNRYAYAANNPYRYVDPDGRELKEVRMMGMDSSTRSAHMTSYYLDSKVAANGVAFVNEARGAYPNLTVNNTFRTQNSREITTTNSRASGLSRHQAGFAIDLNGVRELTDTQRQGLNKIAERHNFSPLEDQASDPPHFSADPTDYGYSNLIDAVLENQQDYREKMVPDFLKGLMGRY